MPRKTVYAGDLRHYGAIQEQVDGSQDPLSGAIPTTWATVNDARGNWSAVPMQKMPLSAREFEAAAAIQAEQSTRFVLRWMPGVTAKMRILLDGVAYNIRGVMEDLESGREYMTLSCTAGVNVG